MIDEDIKLLLRDALLSAPQAETVDEIVRRTDVAEIHVDGGDRRGRPARTLIAISVAAAVAVGLVAVIAFRDHRVVPDESPGDQPSSTDQQVSITDPLSIDLDGMVRTTLATDAGQPSTRTYLIPDLSSLPEGWSIVDRSGGNHPGPNISGKAPAFEWIVTLRSPSGAPFHLLVQDLLPVDPLPGDRTIELPDGTLAHLGGMGLVWNLGSGAQVSLQADGKSHDEQLIELASLFHYVEVSRLPLDPAATIDGTLGTSLATFAGRIGSIPWQVRIPAGDLRSAFVYVAGQSVSGFGNDLLSQPDNSPAWYGALVGVGTPGSVVVGFTPPTVATVSLELRTGEMISLPLDRRTNETWFAAPIPAGLSPAAFIFGDALGNTMRVATVPTVPQDPWGSTDLYAA